MGMMDRDYWKEKHNPNWNKKNRSVNPKYAKGLADLQKQFDQQSESNSKDKFNHEFDPRNIYKPLITLKVERQIKVILKVLITLFIATILVLVDQVPIDNSVKGKAEKTCSVENFQIDSNNDGKFTYKDVGIIALNAYSLPQKFIANKESFETFRNFLEIDKNGCRGIKASIINFVAYIIIFQILFLAISLILLSIKFILKSIIFDLFKVSPFSKFKSTVFKYVYPTYEFNAIGPLTLLLLGGMLLIGVIRFKEEVRAVQDKKIEDHSISIPININSNIKTLKSSVDSNSRQVKEIIPGIITTAQTNFESDFGTVDIEMDITKMIPSREQYSASEDFYFNAKGKGGSISYKVLNLDTDSMVNGKVTMTMWGAEETLINSRTKREPPVCMGSMIRDPTKDDKVTCSGILGTNLSILVRSKLGDNIYLRLMNSNHSIKGFYKSLNSDFEEVAGFKFKNEINLTSQMTHTIHFHGSINSCEFMKPMEVSIISVKNNERKTPIFVHEKEKNFECKDRSVGILTNGILTQKVF